MLLLCYAWCVSAELIHGGWSAALRWIKGRWCQARAVYADLTLVRGRRVIQEIVMQRALLAALFLLLEPSASPARPATYAMTCAEGQALVAASGAIVMSTGRYTYERFVAHGGFCMHGEIADRAYAPTTDNPHCRIGYRCRYRAKLFDDERWIRRRKSR